MSIYVIESSALGKRWAVQADNPQEAVSTVVLFNRGILRKMESDAGGNVDIDIEIKSSGEGLVEL